MADHSYEISPVEYAQTLQTGFWNRDYVQRVELAQHALGLLGNYANGLRDERARFLVDCRTAYLKPDQRFEPRQKLISFGKLSLEGLFDDFSYFNIGKVIMRGREDFSVSALCIDLRDVALLPDGKLLEDSDIMHIPVLAVADTLRVA